MPSSTLIVELWQEADGTWSWQIRDRHSLPVDTGNDRSRARARAGLLFATADAIDQQQTEHTYRPA